MSLSDLVRPLVPQKLRNRLRAWSLRYASRRLGGWAAGKRLPEFAADCRLCGRPNTLHRLLGSVPLTHHGALARRDYRLILCSSGCDVVYLDPLPPPEDLTRLYSDSTQFSDPSYSGSRESARIVAGYARRLRHLGLLPQGGDAILEVGAGFAWICKAAKQHRPDIRTVAQDLSTECAMKCPWVDRYFVGALEELPHEEFRLASLTHVIEHVPDPAGMLARLNAYIAPEGNVYLTAPYRPPLWEERDGFDAWLRYSYLHVPAHISYLSQRWLREAAAQAGFELVHWDDSHDGHQVLEAVLRKKPLP